MMYVDHVKGRASEDTALNYFLEQGYDLVAKNYLVAGIEVDLIFKKENVYYLVEVKSHNLWSAKWPVSYKQMNRLKRAAEIFSDHKQEASVRLVVAIVQGKRVQIDSLDDLL